MGKRGPKPEPAQVAAAKGTSKRTPPPAPTGAPLSAAPPKWMRDKTSPIAIHALVEWKRLHPLLSAKGMLLEKYAGNFAMLCFDYGVWMLGVETAITSGITVEIRQINHRTGAEFVAKVSTRAEIIRAEKAQASYYRRGAAFGLTPSDDGALGLKGSIPVAPADKEPSGRDVVAARRARLTCVGGSAQAM